MIQVNRKFVTLYPRKILEEEDKYDDRWTDTIIQFKEIQKIHYCSYQNDEIYWNHATQIRLMASKCYLPYICKNFLAHYMCNLQLLKLLK